MVKETATRGCRPGGVLKALAIRPGHLAAVISDLTAVLFLHSRHTQRVGRLSALDARKRPFPWSKRLATSFMPGRTGCPRHQIPVLSCLHLVVAQKPGSTSNERPGSCGLGVNQQAFCTATAAAVECTTDDGSRGHTQCTMAGTQSAAAAATAAAPASPPAPSIHGGGACGLPPTSQQTL